MGREAPGSLPGWAMHLGALPLHPRGSYLKQSRNRSADSRLE